MSRSGWSWRKVPQIELATAEALVEILNDDIATIRFDQPSYTASEAGANPNIGIISDVALPTGITLAVSTIVGSATAGEDYTALDNKEAFLPDGYTTGYIENVSITDDNLIELDETFEVVLRAPYGLPPGVELDPLQSRVPVKIESEDTATVVFDEASYEVNEDAGTVDVIFGLEDGVMLADNLAVTVNYGIVQDAGTATAGEDYELATRDSVVLTAVNKQATIRIPILNDDLFEGDEAFAIALLGSSHPRVQATGNTEVTIKDDDSVTVGFIGPASYTVNEGDGSVAVTFGITGNTKLANNETVEFQYATFANPNSASANEDYTDIDLTPVVLTADNPEVTVWIPITNDTTPEGDESFTFAIAPHADFGGTSIVVITITDDDPLGTIGFAEDYYEGKEFINGKAVPQVRVSPLLADTFTLNYVIESGTATAGEDYTSMTMGTVELRPGVLFNSLAIEILVDDIQEGIENFFVRLALPDGASLPPGYSFSETRTEVGILDDEAAQIGFVETSRRFDELYVSGNPNVDDPVIAIGVELEELGETVTLHYVIENGSATFGADYETASTIILSRILDPDATSLYTIEPGIGPTTGTITLYPGTVQPGSYGIVVPLIDDNFVENDETFTIRLFEPPGGLPPFIELYNDTYEVTIQNDDDVVIDFNDTPEVVVHEDHVEAPVSIAVQSSPKFADNTTVTVGYEIRGGSALVGQDYTGTDGTLTFVKDPIAAAFDQPFVVLRIPIIDDDLFELNSAGFNEETFTVTIFHLNEPPISGLSLRSTELKVSIIENDLPDITLRSQTDQWIEDRAGTLRASIPDPLAVDLELSLSVTAAVVGADTGGYLVPNTVTIPAGDRSVVIDVPVTPDDDIAEPDRVLNVVVTQIDHIGLTNPAVYPLAVQPSVAITLVDDDTVELNLAIRPNSIEEGGLALATVNFVGDYQYTAAGDPQAVRLETRDANGDLFDIDAGVTSSSNRAQNGRIVLDLTDGIAEESIALNFEEDQFYQGEQVYTLSLLRDPGLDRSIVFGVDSADITVAENDLPALALNYGGNREVAEGQGIDVELDLTNGGPQGLHEPLAVRLALTTTSSASTSDIDFPSTVTIPRGMSSATFRITARDDMLHGEIEQFELALVSTTPATAAGTTVAFSSGGAITITEVPVPQVTLSLEGGISTIAEGGGSVNVVATLNEPLMGGVPEPLTVELAVEGVSSGDYSLPGDIVIGMGDTTGMVELTIIDDNLAEFAEQLTIKVAQLGYGTNRVAPQVESSVDLTIETDPDDRITATITASDTNEGQMSSVQIGLNLDLPTGVTDNEVKLVLVGTDRGNDVTGSSWNVGTALGSGRMATVDDTFGGGHASGRPRTGLFGVRGQ